MKKPVSRITTGDGAPADTAPLTDRQTAPNLAAQVIAEGLGSVGGLVHGALEVARSAGHRASTAAVTDAAADQSGTSGPARRPDGRSARWAAHRTARRSELIEAAIGAIAEHGAAVGMDQIAAAAHTSKPVIYRYFADKTDLYRAVSQRAVGEVLASLLRVTETNPPPRELLHAGVDAYLSLLEDNPELYRFVSQNPLIGDGDTATDFSTVVAELLTRQMGAHLAEFGLDPSFAHPWGEAVVGFINAASLWWLDHREVMTRPQLTAYLGSLLWGGVAGVLQVAGLEADAAPAPGVFPPLPA